MKVEVDVEGKAKVIRGKCTSAYLDTAAIRSACKRPGSPSRHRQVHSAHYTRQATKSDHRELWGANEWGKGGGVGFLKIYLNENTDCLPLHCWTVALHLYNTVLPINVIKHD